MSRQLRQNGENRVSARTSLPDKYRGMNKTEQARAIELEALRRTGQIADWWYEGVTLKLADDCRLTLDFLIQETDGTLRFEETKGFMREDAKIKYRVASKMFPFPIRVLVKSKNGGWDVEDY